jgi:uncharacterized membrane protein HdeD (DUF308 family)
MDEVKSFASAYRPWNRELPWWVIAAEGVLAALVGIYFVASPDAAASTIRLLLAVLLLAVSVLDIAAGFRHLRTAILPIEPMTPYLLVRGGAGVALALLYFLAARSDYMTEDDARYVLGYGLIAYAIIGLIGTGVALMRGRMHWMAVAANLVYLLIGAVLVYNRRESVSAETGVKYIGWAAIAGGAVLLVYSYFMRQQQEAQAAIPPAAAVIPGMDALTPQPPVAPEPIVAAAMPPADVPAPFAGAPAVDEPAASVEDPTRPSDSQGA